MCKMGPVDPHEMLKGLDNMLGPEGGIKDVHLVDRIITLMKKSNKLVSKCIYLNVIRSTENSEIVESFVENGGWDLMNNWLNDAKADDDTALVVELLKAYQMLPVTVEVLKQNSCAKTIKQISKSGNDEGLKALASHIVKLWMQAVQGGHDGKDKKKHKHDGKSESSHHSKRRDSNSKSSHHNHGSNNNSEHSNHRDTNSDSKGHKSKLKSEERDTPSPDLSKTQSDTNSTTESGASPEHKTRPKTVKTHGSKFRSTGNYRKAAHGSL